MRPLEITLGLILLLTFLLLISNDIFKRHRCTEGITAISLMCIILGTHIIFEGYRWQMIPMYTLSVIFIFLITVRLLKIHTLRQRWFKIIGIVICSCLLLIAFTLPAILPVFTLPSPSGPYKIGTLTYRWNDSGRKDMLSTEGGNREVLAQIWYPSDKVSGSPESYIDNGYEFSKGAAHVVNTSGTMSFKMPDWALSHFQYIKTHAYQGTSVSEKKDKYPVLIYLSGMGGYRQSGMFEIENLVSHGYIVVSIDQPHIAAITTLSNSATVESISRPQIQPLIDQSSKQQNPTPILNSKEMPEGIIPYLSEDVSYVIDKIININTNDPKKVLTQKINTSKIGVFGISLGAIVAAEACHDENRIGACLMMDAQMPRAAYTDGLIQPSMWITRPASDMRLERKESGGWTEEAIALTQSTMIDTFKKSKNADSFFVNINGMFHVNFTDAGYYMPITSLIGLTGPINTKDGYNAINTYTLKFFDKSLLNKNENPCDNTPSATSCKSK